MLCWECRNLRLSYQNLCPWIRLCQEGPGRREQTVFLSHLNSYSGKFSSANYEINESNSSPSTWLGPTQECHHLSVTRLWALHEYLFYHKDSNRSLCCFGLCCEQPYGAFFLLDSAPASASWVSSFYLTPCPKGFGSTLYAGLARQLSGQRHLRPSLFCLNSVPRTHRVGGKNSPCTLSYTAVHTCPPQYKQINDFQRKSTLYVHATQQLPMFKTVD